MWVDVKDYEGLYQINENGQIKRLPGKHSPTERFIKHSVATNGYTQVCLCRDGKAKTLRLHRLLAVAFIANPENKPQVNHMDGIRTNYSLENLEWVTRSENRFHACNVTKNALPPRSMLGRLGKDHNLSKSFYIEFPNKKLTKYESGLEFKRKTGLDNTSISWAKKNKQSGYKFISGKMKGLIVHFEIVGG